MKYVGSVPDVTAANDEPKGDPELPAITCFQLVPPADVVTGVNLLVPDVLSPICP
jgi:hypothetical protein